MCADRSSPEQVQISVAVQRLFEAVRNGSLAAEVLMSVLSGPAAELPNELACLAGQLGFSWEVPE